MRSILVIMRSIKIKFFVLTFVLLLVYLFLFYFFVDKWFNNRTGTSVHTSVVLSYVVVHLDLKGSPPKLKYLESLLPKFKDFGVNGILMEYEDMFPYEGRLVNLSARNCYNKNELKNFLSKSTHLGLEIIPLVQTFGHMEHALKLKEFKHLREVIAFPDSVCPSKTGSRQLITDMLNQVINFHTSVAPLKHIHIGCDEVFQINKCETCRHKNVTSIQIFMNHIHFVDSLIRKFSPDTTVLIWDDMLREKPGLKWTDADFINIELVNWDYKPNFSVSHGNLFNYHKNFKNLWIASAFKGADGRDAIIPDFKNRFINNIGWMDFILDYKFGGETKVYNFKGIILTGWSRYSHMDPLCELLPVSMPSLILNLLLIQTMRKGIVLGDSNMDYEDFYDKYLEKEFNKIVECENILYFDDFNNAVCSFENSDLYNGLKQYSIMNEVFSNHESILSYIEYHSKFKTINMYRAQSSISWCKSTLKKLPNLERILKKYMSPYYEDDVIEEYVSYKIHQSERKVRYTLKMLKRYVEVVHWERRPVQRNISKT